MFSRCVFSRGHEIGHYPIPLIPLGRVPHPNVHWRQWWFHCRQIQTIQLDGTQDTWVSGLTSSLQCDLSELSILPGHQFPFMWNRMTFSSHPHTFLLPKELVKISLFHSTIRRFLETAKGRSQSTMINSTVLRFLTFFFSHFVCSNSKFFWTSIKTVHFLNLNSI